MNCVENVLNRVTDDTFIEIYKNCYKGFEKRDDVERCSLSGSSAEARKYRKQLNTLVKRSLSETIHDTLLTKLDAKLKELEELKEEQTDVTCKWRPPGNAFKHMIPFDAASKTEEKREIESCIEKEKESINLLKMRLIQKRSKACELRDMIQASLDKIERAVVQSVNEDAIKENVSEN
ncbi:UNVERIFIED_CONTAM: hypothetical protein PYX00_000536 [Menopon gallinae]|uniref:Uncharacterized protein n=1 Tax=Menopon gallinae TaxID=328185 RepID=A0AAW2IAN2_9NEOP